MKPLTMIAAAALCMSMFSVSGCATKPHRATVEDMPWMKRDVAGSRIPRKIDPRGQATTATMVRVISEQELISMPGNTLASKLNGGY